MNWWVILNKLKRPKSPVKPKLKVLLLKFNDSMCSGSTVMFNAPPVMVV